MNETSIPKTVHRKPEIGMAPLIDVIFLLLIFFMVTTVFPDEGILIEKPGAEQASRLIDDKLLITIDHNGVVYYKKQLLTVDDLKRLVKDEVNKNPLVSLVINVDKRVITERLIYVIDAAKVSGVEKIGIATEKIKF